MASFASFATSGGTRKAAWANYMIILQGLVQVPRPNAGRKKQTNLAKIRFCKKNFLNHKKNNIYIFIFLLVMPEYEG